MRVSRRPPPLKLVPEVVGQLKTARKNRRMSQDKLAELLDVPLQHVSRIETGEQNITLETLERFAIALGLAVHVVFEHNDAGPQPPPPSRKQRSIARARRRAK